MEDSPRIKQKTFLLGLILVAIAFFAGYRAASVSALPQYASPAEIEALSEDVDLTPFWDAWVVLEEKFVSTDDESTPDKQAKVWGAIQGLAQSYEDPYTVFFPPEEAKLFDEAIRGSFSGVGMEIGIRDDVLTVISPLKGTPAEEAGIESGDVILEIDGEASATMNVHKAVSLIRGPQGSTVSLLLGREGEDEPIEVEVIRDVINIPTINTEEEGEDTFVIELYNFSAPSPQLFEQALQDFLRSDRDKLILDLRGNAGGFLDAAVDVASHFLREGAVVVREEAQDQEKEEVYRSQGYGTVPASVPMVVLVDGGSASAAEIVAGALQEQGRATLVGTQTFGKGSVQELVRLTPETALKITIARWLTPEGTSLSADGLSPDIVVERSSEDVESGDDPQLDRALEVLGN